jgi:hypothetical protein
VLSGAQVVHDRALKRLSLRQAVERSWTRSAKDKPDDLVVSSSQELQLCDAALLARKVPLVERSRLRERRIAGFRRSIC